MSQHPGVTGPLASGPTPELLLSPEPDLSRFGFSEASRVVLVGLSGLWFVVRRCSMWMLGRLVGRLFRRATDTSYAGLVDAAADGLIDAFMHLGPTFVKLGQVIASSAGLFPDALALRARRCLDAAPEFSPALVRATIAEDLGHPVEELFRFFGDVPLSAASIGQVHACTTRDGRDAVVKVQRPNLRSQMTTDLRVLNLLARLAQRTSWGRSVNVTGMVADLSRLTARELNPVMEAWNQERFRDNLWVFGDNSHVTAPEVYWDYCGLRTICMERVYGIPMDDYTTIAERGVDGELVLRRGAKAWAEAVMIHGPFHGDLHAGNIWVLDDGRGCFLDFGIMGELDDGWRSVMREIYYTCVFDRDYTRIARAYRSVGVFPGDLGSDDEIGAAIGMILGPLLDSGMESINLGELITSSVNLMRDFGGTPPQELMLVGKQLLYIERYTKQLAPNYAVITDPFLVKNVFPEAAKELAARTGIEFPD